MTVEEWQEKNELDRHITIYGHLTLDSTPLYQEKNESHRLARRAFLMTKGMADSIPPVQVNPNPMRTVIALLTTPPCALQSHCQPHPHAHRNRTVNHTPMRTAIALSTTPPCTLQSHC
jgi:hypothetical protein